MFSRYIGRVDIFGFNIFDFNILGFSKKYDFFFLEGGGGRGWLWRFLWKIWGLLLNCMDYSYNQLLLIVICDEIHPKALLNSY